MNIKLGIICWEKKVNRENQVPTAISITGGSKRIYVATPIRVERYIYEKWMQDGRVMGKGMEKWRKEYAFLTESIYAIGEMIDNRRINRNPMSLLEVKEALRAEMTIAGEPQRRNARPDFIDFYGKHVEYIGKSKSKGYHRHYEVEFNSFKKFAGERLPFSKVTVELLEKYEIHLKTKSNGDSLKDTTLNTKVRRLMQIVHKAVSCELIPKKQILGYRVPLYKTPQGKYLTLEQVRKIEEWLYDGKFDYEQKLRAVVCGFLIGCNGGLRFGDWTRYRLETIDNRERFVLQAKKNNRLISLPFDTFISLRRIVTYIRDNRIEIKVIEQETNRLLKVIALKLNDTECPLFFGKLTTHVGRHTFGTILGEKGWNTANIAEAMGISEKTARVYVQRTRGGFDNEANRFGAW